MAATPAKCASVVKPATPFFDVPAHTGLETLTFLGQSKKWLPVRFREALKKLASSAENAKSQLEAIDSG